MPDKVGQQIGNYRLVRLLGSGGFADVYLGQHVHLASKQAAVKMLKLFDVDVEKFQQEAETTEQLVHPHIVRLLDFALQEGTPFLVLDYAPGGTLRARHPKGSQLQLNTVVAYLNEITPALQYAHDRNILHRDIKPDNMLIGRQGELLISDFGMAVLSQTGRTSLQASYGIGGTPFYMAPEMFRGKPEKASDQYSLAVVVYEWLCGSLPFSEGGFIQLGYQHTHEPVPPLREKNSSLSSDVEAVILTALAKDPKQRFGSVRAFANALEQACLPSQKALPIVEPVPSESPSAGISTIQIAPQEEVVSQQPEPSVPAVEPVSEQIASVRPTELPVQTPPVIQQPRQRDTVSSHTALAAPSTRANVPPEVAVVSCLFTRRQVVGLGLAGAGLAVTSIGGIGIRLWETAHLSPVVSVTPTPKPMPKLIGPLLTYRGHDDSVVFSIAWSPDGKRIASGSNSYEFQVWDAANGRLDFATHGNTDLVNYIAWSPDGKRIASDGIRDAVQILDAADGRNILTYRGGYSADWSPDGKLIASVSSDKTVQVWNASDGTNISTYSIHSGAVISADWSPDGKRIASASDDGTLEVWNASDGTNISTYSMHAGTVNSADWSPNWKRIALGTSDGSAQIWNAMDGTHVFTYRGHSSRVVTVAWSPDGKRIASASDDGSVHVWNASDGTHVSTYQAHGDTIVPVAWSPDGKRIALEDVYVEIWEAV